MTPDDALSSLDRQLASSGEDVILQRLVGSANQVVIPGKVRAFVRNYEPRELVGSVIQGDSKVTVSPTDIENARWPGPRVVRAVPDATDARIPRKDDRVVIAGKTRTVQAAAPIYLAGVLIRIDLQVRG